MKKFIGIIVLIFIIGALAAGVWYVFKQSNKPLSEDDLKSNIENVQAIVSEASLLANLAANGKTTSNYTKVQSENLSDNLRSQVKQLLSFPSKPSLKNLIIKQRYLISTANSSLRQLESSPGNKQTAKIVSNRLGTIFLQEGELGKHL